ncbi:MAG: response regulator transcription factor [Chloroflexi bacterium]|nr:response regulator transcription factor [Chloroflexota bacterium]
MPPLRVLLVDDHVLFRKGLAALLATCPQVTVVGEASDGFEALAKARETTPDVILMDVHMPRCDGLAATAAIRGIMPQVQIVMLTISDDEEDLFTAIKNGADGYLLKDLEPEQLFRQLEGLQRGEAPISGVLAAKILAELKRPAPATVEQEEPGALTEREGEVLRWVAEGASNKEIAGHLSITENTVKIHLRNILEKLHLENRIQAAVYAVRQGLTGRSADR